MPFQQFELHTKLPVDQVLARIRTLTRERIGLVQHLRESLRIDASETPPFIGKVSGNTFQIRRDIKYQNSFLPFISGVVSPTANGSTVRVIMRLHIFNAVFILIWLGGVALFSILALAHGNPDLFFILVTVVMFLFGIGLTIVCFFPEARKSRKLLQEAIDAIDA